MRGWFAVIAAGQILFLAGQAAYYERWKAAGQTVELRVAPVDPRSLFLGNYLALSYDISRPPRAGLAPGSVRLDSLPEGATVFAELEPRKGGARLTGLYARRPDAPAGGRVYLRGRKSGDFIVYGLERYYIPEARPEEVRNLEQSLASRERPAVVTVEAAVSRSGRGMIRRVLVDGRPLNL